ncbi:putative purine permease 10 [Salvia divinorum]|uniref:Purine permease 10 n=1 Tax=Salvia divinorum TaxID=28513 RepID=A0ABD1HLK1_SALDI
MSKRPYFYLTEYSGISRAYRINKETAACTVIEMTIYQSPAIAISLFASGEWRQLEEEMEGYEREKVAYVIKLDVLI